MAIKGARERPAILIARAQGYTAKDRPEINIPRDKQPVRVICQAVTILASSAPCSS
jgi:hypothetical protein